jgi:pimeloyl-ACP methyl ester carboxylesterase
LTRPGQNALLPAAIALPFLVERAGSIARSSAACGSFAASAGVSTARSATGNTDIEASPVRFGRDGCIMTGAAPASVPACPPLQVATLSDRPLSFRSCGDGDTLVFLHGLLGSSKSWAFQFAHLSPHFRVIGWDAPGFGQSDLVAPSIDACVDTLREFVADIVQPRIHLVGHSMGGTVAARFAARCPDVVSRLVLSCTHPGYGEPETAPMSVKFERRMREFHNIGPTAYGVNRARDLLPASTPAGVFDHAAEVASEVHPEGLRRATRMLLLADNRPLLPGLTMPVLILTGEMDRYVRPDLKADLLRLTPAARHVEIPGVRHAPYFEAPRDYSDLIKSFLSEE